MTTSNNQNSDRQYFLDWLRILLITSVFLYHIGMIFISWNWHVKNDITCGYKSGLWYIMVFLHEWRLPLLVLISGAGTYLALGKRTPIQYLGERFKRLFIPLIIGIFTLVPVQVYIEKSAGYGSLLDFYPHMFDGLYPKGNFSWHHLWFIAYLFFIALVITPFLNFMRSGRFDLFIGKMDRIVSRRLGANVFLLPLIFSQVILRHFFPEDTHALLDDWAEVFNFFIFFLSGFILASNKNLTESIRKQKKLFLLQCIAGTVMLFTIPYLLKPDWASDTAWNILEAVVAWSCGMTAIGYAKQYLNKNNKFRKYGNEAIYPFYLLHQPVIVVIGHWIVGMDIAVAWKVILITLISFTLTVSIYWLIIRPFNIMRIIFGMKIKNKVSYTPGLSWSA